MQTEKKKYSVYIPPFDYDKRGDRLYQVWRGMLMRCFNPNSKEYYRYGGRGITMCDEWRLDYEAFKAWAMPMGVWHSSALCAQNVYRQRRSLELRHRRI